MLAIHPSLEELQYSQVSHLSLPPLCKRQLCYCTSQADATWISLPVAREDRDLLRKHLPDTWISSRVQKQVKERQQPECSPSNLLLQDYFFKATPTMQELRFKLSLRSEKEKGNARTTGQKGEIRQRGCPTFWERSQVLFLESSLITAEDAS